MTSAQAAAEAISALAEAAAQLQAESWGVPSPTRPAASRIPFLMRLPAVQQHLIELEAVRVDDTPDTEWALDVDEARDAADGALEAVAVALAVLTQPSTAADHSGQDAARIAYRLPKQLHTLNAALAHLHELLTRWPGDTDRHQPHQPR